MSSEPARNNTIRILMIEDDAEYVSLIRALLRVMWDTPSTLEHAGTLAQGLELLHSGRFDVVLLDLTLPDCYGFETFTTLRARAGQIPVIVLTGTSDRVLALRAVREGAQDYLVKGQVEGDLLIRSIRYAIERQRADKALRESEERYRCLFNTTHLVMLLVDPHTQEIVDANPAAISFYGYPHEDLIGKTMADLSLPPVQHLTPPHPLHSRHVLANGEAREVEVYTSPILVNDKELLYMIVHDVTERKRVEEELRQRNEALVALNTIARMIGQAHDLNSVLRAILETVLKLTDQDIGWIKRLNNDGAGIEVEPVVCYRYTRSAQERVGPCIERLTAAIARLEEPAVLRDLCGNATCVGIPLQAGGRILGILGLCGSSTGTIGAEELQILTAIGHQAGIAIENDRLAREAAELEVLQEIDRLRSELIANISHELRTPLGLIKVFCTTLLREDIALDPVTQRELLHDIDEETERLERIVDNLLDLSRIEDGRLQLQKQPTNLNPLIEEVVKDMAPEAQPTLHRIICDLPSTPLVAIVDPRRIEQVLRNLISNAIKYSPQGGEIVIGGRGDNTQILVWVRDQGIGIPQEDLERIFERFYRVPNEVTSRVGGAGLGLAVCRGIVEAHGGRIWAESTLHKGSTFYFTLPRGIP
ncbi:MAG: ATP-binding protein [Anaerolineae bacterium]|nr:ATP-binding protein [Anaerolineae bacterium]